MKYQKIRNIVFLFFCFFFLISFLKLSHSYQEELSYTEYFPEYFNDQISDLDSVSKNTFTTSTVYPGSLTWYLGEAGSPGTSSNFETISYFWSSPSSLDRQLRYNITQPTFVDSLVMIYTFPDEVTIYNTSKIEWYWNSTEYSAEPLFLFKNSSQPESCNLYYKMFNLTSWSGLAEEDICDTKWQYSCNDYSPGVPLNNTVITKYSKTLNNCQIPETGIKHIKYLYVVFYSPWAVTSTLYLDNLTISGIFNGSNDLPFFNISWNINSTYLCIENSTVETQLNFTINATDLENDTIYYGIDTSNGATNQDVYKFTYYDNVFGTSCIPGSNPIFTCNPNEDFSVNEIIQNNNDYCSLNVGFYNSSYLNYIISDSLRYNYGTYKLYIQDSCKGNNKGVLYKLNYPVKNFVFSTGIYDLEETESLVFKSLSSSLSENLILNFSNENNRIIIRNFDSLGNNKIVMNKSKVDFDLNSSLLFQVSLNNNFIIDLYIQDSNNSNFYNFTNLITSTEFTEYLSFTLISGEIGLEDYSLTTYLDELSYSTVKPNNVTVQGLGTYTYSIAVTDTDHLNNNYDYDTIEITLIDKTVNSNLCSLDLNTQALTNIKKPSTRSFWFVFSLLKVTLGDKARSFFISLGLIEIVPIVLGFVLFIIFIVGNIGVFFATGKLNITPPLIMVSFGGLFFSYLLSFTDGIIFYGFILLLGIAMPIAQHFMSETGGYNG